MLWQNALHYIDFLFFYTFFRENVWHDSCKVFACYEKIRIRKEESDGIWDYLKTAN